jgi:hypothetical protein
MRRHRQSRKTRTTTLWPLRGRLLGSAKCPLWVRSRHLSVRQGCPLYPRKQTFSEQGIMSAKCQKRTSRSRRGLSPKYSRLELHPARRAGSDVELQFFEHNSFRLCSSPTSELGCDHSALREVCSMKRLAAVCLLAGTMGISGAAQAGPVSGSVLGVTATSSGVVLAHYRGRRNCYHRRGWWNRYACRRKHRHLRRNGYQRRHHRHQRGRKWR